MWNSGEDSGCSSGGESVQTNNQARVRGRDQEHHHLRPQGAAQEEVLQHHSQQVSGGGGPGAGETMSQGAQTSVYSGRASEVF